MSQPCRHTETIPSLEVRADSTASFAGDGYRRKEHRCCICCRCFLGELLDSETSFGWIPLDQVLCWETVAAGQLREEFVKNLVTGNI